MAITLLYRGQFVPVPPVETALRFLSAQGEGVATGLPLAGVPGRRFIVGAPATVRRAIEALAHEYGADECMIVTITHDHAARRRSYELVAEEFALRGEARTAAAGVA